MYPLILRNAIDDNFRKYVIDFVDRNQGYFRPNGYGRFYLSHVIDDVIEEQKKRLLESFGIHSYETEPMFGNFIGRNFEGAFVHPHSDPAPEGYTHLRVNIMVSKPIEGGQPFIENRLIDVNEKDVWICLASIQKHKTNPVVGPISRIVPSLGVLVKTDNIQDKINDYLRWLG